MNRPKQEDYFEDTMMAKFTRFDYDSYTDAIEEYCDELEKALDKAIKQIVYLDHLVEITTLSPRTNHLTEAEWKEWILKDD